MALVAILFKLVQSEEIKHSLHILSIPISNPLTSSICMRSGIFISLSPYLDSCRQPDSLDDDVPCAEIFSKILIKSYREIPKINNPERNIQSSRKAACGFSS